MTNFAQTPQFSALVVLDQTISSQVAATPQLSELVVTDGPSDPRTSQLAALVVYGEGARENLRLRAWTFVLDGHTFYVLHLGMLGTFVCDVALASATSGELGWSRWETEGMDNWNAEQGLMWQDRIIAGDNQNPILWYIDPREALDEDGFKPIRRVATALLPARGRDTVTVGMFSLNTSAGYPSQIGADVVLRFSDDNGVTFTSQPAITLEAANYTQNLAWGSLGTFGQPGRILEIEDFGGFVRLSDADIVVTGGKDDA